MASNRIKGITIEIEGNTTKLTDSLKKVDSSLRDTQAQLRDVNKLLKYDPGNVDLLRQKHELLKKAVDDTKERQKLLTQALEEAKKAGDTAENRKQQDMLQRELAETTTKLQDLEKQYRDSSPVLKSISVKTGELAEKTKGVSTAAGVAAAGFLAMAYKAGTAADDLMTMANVTGLSVEELQKLQYASSFVDVPLETMTGSIAKLTKTMASGSDAFETLGISITNQDGTMRDATDVWYDAIEALGKVENDTLRDQLAMELFGKSAMEMAGIVDDGGASLKALGDDLEATGTILSEDAVADTVKFNDAIDELKGKATQAFFSAGAALADDLVPMLEKLVDVVTGVLQWFGNLDGTTQTLILTVLGLVAAISPVLSLISTLTSLAGALNVAMLPMIGTIGAVVAAIAAAIAIGVALYKNWDTIKEKAGELWNNLKTIFGNIKDTITEKINGAKEAVGTAIDKIKGFFNFKWELPKIKLPHFKVSGSANPLRWLDEGVPKLSVEWYRKAMDTAYMLTKPTIFGAQNGTLLGGGEAGAEMVVGRDALMNMIRSATGSTNTVSVNVVVNGNVDDYEALANTIADRINEKVMRQDEVFV